MKEIWKDIPGYENLYQVSNVGRVKSLAKHYRKEMIMKLQLDKGGYYRVCLRKDNKVSQFMIHRLVMEVFNPTINHRRLEVNHKDFNKLNNKLGNLEWCTRKENIEFNKKRIDARHYGKKVQDNFGNIFISYREAGRYHKISPNIVKRDCLNITKRVENDRKVLFSFLKGGR